jgi:opacity protein-like surface antigen
MRRRLAAILMVLLAGAAVCRADVIPNEPYYVSHQWYGPVLGLPQAWDISQGSAAVTVAVLDTGVMSWTPDLAGRLLAPLSATGSAPLDGTDVHHGTWVASVVAMGVSDGLGGAGVGNFSILPITVTNSAGHNSSDWIAKGIEMAAAAGARVINVSSGTLDYWTVNVAAGHARDKGALVFVSAGNSNKESNMTDYANLVFVAGTGRNDQRWDNGLNLPGSTWGPFVDLAAPADDILVADPTLTSGYGLRDGTSFAAPLAAGAAALAWSINPDLTADEVLGLLYDTAVDLGDPGWDEVYGHGRLNIGGVAAGAYATITPEPATLALMFAGLAAAAVFGRRRRRIS